jgi:hypothetical protein
VLNLLKRGRLVAITLPVFVDGNNRDIDNWNADLARVYGVVMDPPPSAVAEVGHAVCVTGFVPDASEPMGGYFVFRNSWGSAWANTAPSAGTRYHTPQPGYGQVTASYVEKYLWEACCM